MAKYKCPFCNDGFAHTSGPIPNPKEWLLIPHKGFDTMNDTITRDELYSQMTHLFECVNNECEGIAVFWEGFRENPLWYNTNEFASIVRKPESENSIWVFNGANSRFPGGVFEDFGKAENWIKENKLTGVLTKYPTDIGVLDWACENNQTAMKPEKLEEKKNDPNFIGGFTTASMQHYHYENGNRG